MSLVCMSDDTDIIGSITGTATFDHVHINREPNRYVVTGYYQQSETPYGVPHGKLRIDGLSIAVNDTATIDSDDGEYVWVKATDDILNITAEKPDSA